MRISPNLVLDYSCDLVYVADIFVRMHEGYLDNGIMIKDAKLLRKNYLREVSIWSVSVFWWTSPLALRLPLHPIPSGLYGPRRPTKCASPLSYSKESNEPFPEGLLLHPGLSQHLPHGLCLLSVQLQLLRADPLPRHTEAQQDPQDLPDDGLLQQDRN